MPGLVSGIHVGPAARRIEARAVIQISSIAQRPDVDARDKPGHDDL